MRYLFLLPVFVAGCLPLTAQGVFNDANVIIQQNISVTTNGSWDNSGFIINNGFITFTGNWINTFVYQGLGSVSLTGIDQQINNNRQSFNALSIGGGGIKTVKGSFTIDRLLTLEEGILNVSDVDTLRMFPGAITEGGSPGSHVDGAMIALGTGYKFFPVGKNGKYHPVELLNVTGINPVLEVEVQENFQPVTASLPATPFADIYWTQKVINGSYDGSPVTIRYNVPDDLEDARLVMLEGNLFSDPFTARETRLTRSNDLDLIESRNSLTGTTLALAALAVEPPKEYYFSTTLSPHANNPENRVIKIFGDQVTPTDFRFQVFNRWGLVMYETTSADTMMTEGWDGRHKGSLLPSGIYPYSLSYVDASGRTVKRTGFITIIQ